MRCQENMNALQVEGFDQNQHTYCEQLTIADTHKNHLVEIQTDLHETTFFLQYIEKSI